MTALAVFLGGMLGGAARYALSVWLAPRDTGKLSRIPWGIVAANVIGCFVLGALTGLVSGWQRDLLAVGLCGGLTTFSTFAIDAVVLVEQRSRWLAAGYVVVSVVLGWAAAAAGLAL